MRIPKATVKNKVDLNFEVPPAVASLIAEFTKSYRVALMPTSSRYLFTKRSADAPIDWNTLRRRITDAICRNVGVRLTPHNFRHVAAFILLSKFPGGYEQVRRLLGHKNGSTALDHYVGLENDAAHRIFVQLLSELEKDDHE
jgi:integrase